MTASGISAYEKGHRNPSAAVFEKITSVIRFKPAFFLRPEDPPQNQVVFERSRASATKSTRLAAQHRRVWLRDTTQYLSRFVRFPDPDVPQIPYHEGWQRLSGSQIESFARETRRHWRLGDGPISNVTLLAENNGVIVTSIPMNAQNLDAFSLWDRIDNRPYIVLGDDNQSAFRTRFNICHELGHLVLHSNIPTHEATAPDQLKTLESQADRFAAAFLTPASTFSSEVTTPKLELFRLLKPRWRTSIKMMIHRAQELDIVDREEARKLYIGYNRRGWHRQEPLDQGEHPEEPALLRRVFETLVEQRIILRSQVASDLPFNPEDIEQLANLPYGYLDEDSAYTWAIKTLNSGFEGET